MAARWEYWVETIKSIDIRMAWLDHFGSEGWELVSVIVFVGAGEGQCERLYFKRRID